MLGCVSSESCANITHFYLDLDPSSCPGTQRTLVFHILLQFLFKTQSFSLESFVMPGPWDASSERKLLLCIIGLQSKLVWAVIAQRMGEQFTEEACR